MTRRDALTAIFGTAAAPLVEAADVNVLPKEAGGPLMLVVSFDKEFYAIDQATIARIRSKFAELVPGIPVAVLAHGMRLEAIYRTPPVKIHEKIGECYGEVTEQRRLCTTCKSRPANHETSFEGKTDYQCCECHVKAYNTPADWHPDCMRAYAALNH